MPTAFISKPCHSARWREYTESFPPDTSATAPLTKRIIKQVTKSITVAVGENKKRAKRKDPIEMAVQWLKERGINPHISERDIIKMGLFEAMASGCSFETLTGYVKIPDPETVQRLQDTDYFKGTIEHEFFHRADYLDKFGGNKKLRREVYKRWEAAREIPRLIEKHKEYLDEKHPLAQAIAELKIMGYDVEESLIRLWCENPEKFKKTLEKATQLRRLESVIGSNSPLLKYASELTKQYFMLTPVKPGLSEIEKFYNVSSEIPAYLISETLKGKSIEEGLATAKSTIISDKYFGNTELESIARKTAIKYQTIAHILKRKGLNDDQVLRAMIALHKNIYSLDYADMLAKNRRMIEVAAKLIKTGGYKAEEIRETIAAQALALMNKTVKKAAKIVEKERRERTRDWTP